MVTPLAAIFNTNTVVYLSVCCCKKRACAVKANSKVFIVMPPDTALNICKQHSPFYVKPAFSIGQRVTKNGELYTIARVHGLNTGNRPSYKLEGKQGIYPEMSLKAVEE